MYQIIYEISTNTSASTQWVKDATEYRAIYVDGTNGDDSNDGLTSETAVKTIGRGISLQDNRARWLKVIHLAAGTYTENVLVEGFFIKFNLLGNVTLNGRIQGGSGSIIILQGDPNTLTISSGNNYSIQLANTSMFCSNVPISMTCTGGSYAVSASLDSTMIFTKTVNINASNTTIGAIYVNANSSLYAGIGMTITGSSNSTGIQVAHGSNLTSNGVDIGSGVSSGTALYITNNSLFKVYSGTISLYGGSGFVLDVVQNSSVMLDGASTLSITKTGTGTGLISSSGSVVLINVASGKTCTLSQTGASNTEFLYSNLGGVLRFAGSGTLSFSGKATNATVASEACSYVYLDKNLTINGTVTTAKRYNALSGSHIDVMGSGASRIPGAAAGTVETASYSYYG